MLGVVWAGDELACGRLCVSGGSGREALRACPSSGRAQRAGLRQLADAPRRQRKDERLVGTAGNASPTAFATAAGAPTMPASPAPFTPSGLSGTGCSTMTGRIRSGSTSRSAASSIVPRSESTASSPGSRRWCAPRCSGSSRSRRASARGGRMTLSNVLACRISHQAAAARSHPHASASTCSERRQTPSSGETIVGWIPLGPCLGGRHPRLGDPDPDCFLDRVFRLVAQRDVMRPGVKRIDRPQWAAADLLAVDEPDEVLVGSCSTGPFRVGDVSLELDWCVSEHTVAAGGTGDRQ